MCVGNSENERRIKGNPVIALGIAGVLSVVVIARSFAARIYDVVITRLTIRWYEKVLESFEDGSKILDVGVGTLSALAPHADKIRSKKLKVAGVDYESAYIEAAKLRIEKGDLADNVTVTCASVYDAEVLQSLAGKKPFDGAYFSGSLTLMPDPVAALRAAGAVVRSGGTIHCTQTYQRRALPMLATVKPLLKYVTTIDFGQLTTESQALVIFKESGYDILHHGVIQDSVDNAFQAAYHTILAVP